jgi:hypothetical protein
VLAALLIVALGSVLWLNVARTYIVQHPDGYNGKRRECRRVLPIL